MASDTVRLAAMVVRHFVACDETDETIAEPMREAAVAAKCEYDNLRAKLAEARALLERVATVDGNAFTSEAHAETVLDARAWLAANPVTEAKR